VQDLLLLRRNSQIFTNAGKLQAIGDGGNITINAPNGFIVAKPKKTAILPMLHWFWWQSPNQRYWYFWHRAT
jgi:hypothetical protein